MMTMNDYHYKMKYFEYIFITYAILIQKLTTVFLEPKWRGCYSTISRSRAS